ncbi:cadherin-23 isoform X2 [Patella vulgata]|uniref:cadherin-23 isoform X2 n=1 Tax=Patella vulgata TaxID=6465 RepID=UPI00217F4510|nr:cadherin-23 isoform X2 [Patella vulgata]
MKIFVISLLALLIGVLTFTEATRPPVFSQNSYVIIVNENVNGTEVTSIKDKVTDPDFNTVLEFFYSGPDYELFVLIDGVLYFKGDYFLDGSRPSNVSLVVSAADRTGLTATAAFEIEILDVNQLPVLHNLPSSAEIPEMTTPRINLFKINATDRDRNTVLTYGMIPSAAVTAADFEIDTTTGIITLVTGNVMDYDSNSVKNFTIEITVSDQTATSTSTLTVTVTNVDEAPVFDSSFNGNVTIPEGKAGEIVFSDIKNFVTDPESNIVTFDLQTGLHAEKFSIDQTSGTITYAADYNVDPAGLPGQVTLVVLAKDSTDLSSSVTMVIEITDANQAPRFNNLPGTIIVDENTASLTDVFTFNATDPDSNDVLTITVTVPVAEFTLSVSGDVLSVSSGATLNYEVENSYTMTFQVSDGVLTDTQTLTINIKDVAEAPVFTEPNYLITMDESMKGTELTTLTGRITDDDGQTTFAYTLTGNDANKFIINNGKILFDVDYYVGASPAKPDLGVVARDSSGLNATATFDITILDINQAPVFTNLPNSNQLPEIVDPETVLFTASVNDPDQADTITIAWTLPASGIDPADFSLDPSTGVITLVTGNVMDFEASSVKFFTIELTASDGTLTVTSTLTITVTNKNEPPIFNSTWTQIVSAPEGKMGDTVYSDLSTVVTDPEGNIVRYAIQNGLNSDKFYIHPFSGIITYEENYNVDPAGLPPQVLLTVAAVDTSSSLSSTATMTINIMDANQPPKWTNLPATIDVREDEAPGNTVITFTASDPDSLDVPALVFSELGGTTDLVVIGANLDIVSIDFETKQMYTLTIQVTDPAGGTDNQTLTINIKDVPEPPVFNQIPNYMLTIPEGVKGTIVASIPDKITDGDNDTFFTYELSGTDASKFTVLANGSILYDVDYYLGMSPPTATITVTVSDLTSKTATTDFIFTVTNVNQPPIFTNLPNSTNVAEIVTLPHLLFRAMASDLDAADIPGLDYSMSVSDSVSAADFFLDITTGAITLTNGNVMDYDTSITKSFTINMTVTDNKSTSTGTLTVTVTNVDEPPIFNSSWTKSTSAMEGKAGQTVYNDLQNVVSDPEGNPITYTIQPGTHSDKFSINPSTGLISYDVDYDTDPSQTNFPNTVVLTIVATDSTNLSTSDTLTININSVNQPPQFTKFPTPVDILENTAPLDVVFTFTGTDPDSADIPLLTYSILNGVDKFTVSGSDLIVSNGVILDYETKTSYILEMQVSDGKSTDNQTLTINIQNVEEPPMFQQTTYTLNIPEAKMGTVVISPLTAYNVSDPEQQALTFTITGTHADKFTIDPLNGVISYAVDYFLGAPAFPNSLSLTVTATDPSSMSASATLNIAIDNLNQPPEFTNLPDNASLPENVAIATPIITVQASDPDSNPTTIKLLNSLPTNTFFEFDGTNNMVTTKTALDYESPNKQFELTFTVEDAMTTSTATLTIIIEDVNEPPTFAQNTFTLTLEEGNMGTTVFESAQYVNDPEKQPLNYSITIGTGSDNFQIDMTTGVVSYAVNYYLGGTPGLPASVSLVVVATDHSSLTTSTTLDITVSDVNQPPQITKPPPVLYVRENVTLNTLVYTINAIDNDGETIQYAEIYTWPENTGILFGIDATNGEIRTTSVLDYEASYKQLRIYFTAADSTSTSTSSLTINIVDVNEPPTFSQASETVTVPEGKAQSTIIPSLRVYVTDPESPTESITFSINPSKHSNKFTIDRNTGSLVYAVDYDVDDSQFPSSVSLSISATDPFFLSGTATFNINIVHVNNPPILTNLPKNVLISEDAASGTSVFTASARDDDPGDTLTFSLDRSTSTVLSLFQIDPTSGVITTRSTNGQMLDFETMQNSLNIEVTVKDGSGDSVTRTLAITLSNVNEPPQFTPALRVYSVSEGKAGTQVTPGFSSSVTDPEGGTVNFRLVSGPNSDKFRIDQTTGAISFASDYDADPARSPSNVNLVVMAVDSSSLSSSVTVNIQIQNVNQPPKFTNLPLSVSVLDTSSPGTVIFTASASDEDTDDTLSFTLSPRSALNLVNYLDINVRTGDIILLNSLTSAGSSLQYDIKVSDGTATIQDILSINIVNTAVATTTINTDVATPNTNQPRNAASSTDDSLPISTILLIVAIIAVALFAIGIGVYCYKTKCAPPKKRRRRREEKRHQPKLYQVSPRYGPPTPRNDDIYRDYYYNYS